MPWEPATTALVVRRMTTILFPVYSTFANDKLVPVMLVALVLRGVGNHWTEQSPKIRHTGQISGLVSALGFAMFHPQRVPFPKSYSLLEFIIRLACVQASVQALMQLSLIALGELLRTPYGMLSSLLSQITQAFRQAVSQLRVSVSLAEARSREPPPPPPPVRPPVVQVPAAPDPRIAEQRIAARRRESARLRLQLFYDRHRWELKDYLPESQLQMYFATFITNTLDPEDYEERVGLLEQMLTDRWQAQGYQIDGEPRPWRRFCKTLPRRKKSFESWSPIPISLKRCGPFWQRLVMNS